MEGDVYILIMPATRIATYYINYTLDFSVIIIILLRGIISF